MNTVIREELIPFDAIREVVSNGLRDEFWYVMDCIPEEDKRDVLKNLCDSSYKELRDYIVADTTADYPCAQLVALLELQIFLEEYQKV
jgi:hypothetical protein